MLKREIRFFERLNKSSQRCQKHVFCWILLYESLISIYHHKGFGTWRRKRARICEGVQGGGDTHSDNESQRKVAANVTQIQSDFFFLFFY